MRREEEDVKERRSFESERRNEGKRRGRASSGRLRRAALPADLSPDSSHRFLAPCLGGRLQSVRKRTSAAADLG